MPARVCLDWPHPGCPRLIYTGSRCAAGRAVRQQQRNLERPIHSRLIREYVETFGWVCPGAEGHPPHPSTDLTVDHLIPGNTHSPRRILCRSENSRRGNRSVR